LLKPRGSRRKILWVSVVLILFSILPAVNTRERWQADAFAKEAWAYYRKLGAEKEDEGRREVTNRDLKAAGRGDAVTNCGRTRLLVADDPQEGKPKRNIGYLG